MTHYQAPQYEGPEMSQPMVDFHLKGNSRKKIGATAATAGLASAANATYVTMLPGEFYSETLTQGDFSVDYKLTYEGIQDSKHIWTFGFDNVSNSSSLDYAIKDISIMSGIDYADITSLNPSGEQGSGWTFNAQDPSDLIGSAESLGDYVVPENLSASANNLNLEALTNQNQSYNARVPGTITFTTRDDNTYNFSTYVSGAIPEPSSALVLGPALLFSLLAQRKRKQN